MEKVIQLMEQAEMKFTGREHYLLAKVRLKKLLRQFKGEDIEFGRPRAELDKGGTVEGRLEEEEGGETEGISVQEGQTAQEGEVEEGKGEEVEEEGAKENETQAGGEEGVDTAEQAELKLEDLEPILELCKKAYSLNDSYGKKAYYGVNGLLLEVVSYLSCCLGVQVSYILHPFSPFFTTPPST